VAIESFSQRRTSCTCYSCEIRFYLATKRAMNWLRFEIFSTPGPSRKPSLNTAARRNGPLRAWIICGEK
jgi:hypothetical protein